MGSLRQRGLAWMMAEGTARYEQMVAPRKQRLLREASGRVVEIGAGTGPNLPYLHAAKSYLAIEPNPYMHPYLEARMAREGIPGVVERSTAEQALSAMPSESVDAVVSTLVLCSVADPTTLLSLTLRVLKPGAPLLFLEHVGAKRGSPLCACQHIVSPFFRLLADGCRPTRDTAGILRKAGFRHLELEEFTLALGPISPHICGYATK